MQLSRMVPSLMMLLVAGTLCSGCIVIPYVVPPLKVQGQGGMAMGELYDEDMVNPDDFAPVIGAPNIRVGAFPLGFSTGLLH